MKEPKWPYEGEDPYQVPVAGENVTLLRIGVGSAAIGTQIQNWVYSFDTLKIFQLAQTFVYFQTGVNLEKDLGYISRSDRPESFITTEKSLNKTLVKQYQNVTQYPFAYQPIVFTYNVPNFYPFTQDCPNQCIILSIEVIALIYMGEITNWNDTRIRDLNDRPMVSELFPAINGVPTKDLLPNTTIIPVGYTQRETYTYFVTSTLWSASHKWRKAFPDGPFDEWPIGHPNISTNLKLVVNAYSPLAAASEDAGTLAYMGLPILYTGAGRFFPYALIHHNGGIRQPQKPQADMLYENTRMDKDNVVKDIDYNSTEGYPFSAITYLIVVQDTEFSRVYCPKDRGTFLFIKWVMTSEEAGVQGQGNGIYRLPDRIHNNIVDQLFDIGCYDDPDNLLDLEIIDDHDYDFFEFLLAISMAFAAIFVGTGAFLTLRKESKNSARKIVIVTYNLILLAGALISYVSVVFYYLIPDSDWVCMTRIWVTGEGFTLFLSAMFARTLQLDRMRKITQSKDIEKRQPESQIKRRALLDFLISSGSCLAIQTILLIIWSTVDPFGSKLSVIDDVARTASWVCKSGNTWIWIGLEIGFFCCMLLFGIYVVMATWQVKDRFPEAKWLLTSIMTNMPILAALIATGANIVIKDKQVFIFATVGITVSITMSLFWLFIDKIGRFLRPGFYKIRSSTSSSYSSKSRSRTGGTIESSTSDSSGASRSKEPA